jgi:hypothetical protein
VAGQRLWNEFGALHRLADARLALDGQYVETRGSSGGGGGTPGRTETDYQDVAAVCFGHAHA